MSKRYQRWMAGCKLSILGGLLLVGGCHGGRRTGETTFLERISRGAHLRVTPKPGELAEKGSAAIVAECEKQSYETARKGLIVSEIGLHEDVFVLRDRVSYAGVGYGLDEAQRLEELLRAESKAAGHAGAQADCIEAFAEHLETLSDPLVEADARLKELDASAFSDATKRAEEQADRKLRGVETSTEQTTTPPPASPRQNY